MDHGHPCSWDYPIGFAIDESNLVIERENTRIVTEATLLQLAVSSILSDKGRTAFRKEINKLNVKTVPHEPPEPFPGTE